VSISVWGARRGALQAEDKSIMVGGILSRKTKIRRVMREGA
jgi:hypothetical protein